MTTTIKLSEFFEYTKINYQEDLYDQVYISDMDVSTDDIEYNLPRKYDHLTKDIINDNRLLKKALQVAYNRAYESGVVSACHSAQDKAVEEYAHKLVEVVNQITGPSNGPALISITIDWPNEQVVIEYNELEANKACLEIINGEGMFLFDSLEQFMGEGNGGVTEHWHYLLNEKLIQSIYGFVKSASFEWSSDDCDFDKDYFAECISDELDEISPYAEKENLENKIKEIAVSIQQLKDLKLID